MILVGILFRITHVESKHATGYPCYYTESYIKNVLCGVRQQNIDIAHLQYNRNYIPVHYVL